MKLTADPPSAIMTHVYKALDTEKLTILRRGRLMTPVKGRYRNQKVELDQPLNLPEDTEVEVVVRAVTSPASSEAAAWHELGMSRLEQEWDNPQDAIYDDWRKLYGV